jgi:phosphate:Na+ symporter
MLGNDRIDEQVSISEPTQEINRLADSAALHQARRLMAEEPNRLPAYTVEMDILQNLKRIYYFAKRMARLVVPSEDLRETTSLREAI